ncbi:RING-type E3 ubiquitin transferase [Entamoeba marina]
MFLLLYLIHLLGIGNCTDSPFSSFLSKTSGNLQLYPPRLLNISDDYKVFEAHLQLTNGRFGKDTTFDFILFLIQLTNETITTGYVVSKRLTPVPIRVIRRNIILNNITSAIENLPHVQLLLPMDSNTTTVSGYITNGELLLSFTLEPINREELEDNAVPYLGFVILLAFLESYAVVKQMDIAHTDSSLKRTSYNTIILIATGDAFQCHMHVYLASMFSLESLAFRLAILSAFLFFMHFSIFDVKFVFSIWKAQYGNASQRSAMLLYLRMYASLFLLFILSVFSLKYFLVICFSMWVPQIYQNIISNNTTVISVQHILELTIPRFGITLYWIAFPYNYMNYQIDILLIGQLILWIIVQLSIIFIQKKWGARVFLPSFLFKLFIHEEYNYHRGWEDIVRRRGEQECVICMSVIDNTHMVEGCPEIVVTPCDHVFHTECLSTWSDYKLDCPTCRQELHGYF